MAPNRCIHRALPVLALLVAAHSTVWSQSTYPVSPADSANFRSPPSAPIDPPGQVARLGLVQGPLSFATADAANATSGDAWTPADLNRPLTRGDRLWTGLQARAELHAGSTAVRLGAETSVDFLALDDSVVQLRLSQGSAQLRVRALFEGQRLEVVTPNLAFVISQPGDYRLDVDPATDTTRVVARVGGGVVYGDGVSLALGGAQQASFSGVQLAPAATGSGQADGFDAWTAERDRREDESVSARYVSRETIGYQQLDAYGDWQQDATYGAVWLPRAVAADWAPYRAGRWSWISPWGWTWIDDAPWGFAPFHYGRWTQIGPRWAWVPGRTAARPVYAPALVGFVGGASGNGAVRPALGWFPLAPGEAFRPAYRASPHYVGRLNGNNPVNPGNGYRYQQQPAALTALSPDDFARGRQVAGRRLPGAAELGAGPLLTDPGAFLPRPGRIDPRERPQLAPALPAPQPRAIALVPALPAIPAVRATPAPFLMPERNVFKAEQRARREQQALQFQHERQRHQQFDLLRQQDQQRRQGEAAMQQQQRGLQEHAHRQQEMFRQQQHQHQQLQFHEQQRRQHAESAMLQQRALHEQARAQQQQRAALPEPPRPLPPGGQPRPADAPHRRGHWHEGGPHRQP